MGNKKNIETFFVGLVQKLLTNSVELQAVMSELNLAKHSRKRPGNP